MCKEEKLNMGIQLSSYLQLPLRPLTHLFSTSLWRYLRSQDALENADRDVRSAVEALSEGHNYLKRKTFLGSPIMSACSIKEKDAKDEKKERESLDFMAAAASQNLQLMQVWMMCGFKSEIDAPCLLQNT